MTAEKKPYKIALWLNVSPHDTSIGAINLFQRLLDEAQVAGYKGPNGTQQTSFTGGASECRVEFEPEDHHAEHLDKVLLFRMKMLQRDPFTLAPMPLMAGLVVVLCLREVRLAENGQDVPFHISDEESRAGLWSWWFDGFSRGCHLLENDQKQTLVLIGPEQDDYPRDHYALKVCVIQSWIGVLPVMRDLLNQPRHQK